MVSRFRSRRLQVGQLLSRIPVEHRHSRFALSRPTGLMDLHSHRRCLMSRLSAGTLGASGKCCTSVSDTQSILVLDMLASIDRDEISCLKFTNLTI